MQVSEFLADYRKKTTPLAQAFFTEWKNEAYKAGVLPVEVLERFASLYPKGKQFRGAMTVLGYELAGKNPNEDIFYASLLMEVLHTAFLVADDVFDNDDLRRGEATIHKQWEFTAHSKGYKHACAYGKNMAFDTAIIGFYLAPLVLQKTSFSSDSKLKALDYVFKTSIEVAWGEALDISAPLQDSTTNRQATAIIHAYKTVNYTGVMPLKLGALLAGKEDPQWVSVLEKYGEYVGKIFQIQDDIIGSFGKSEVTGKAADSDIKQARWTILAQLLFEKAEGEDRQLVEIIFNQKQRTEQDVACVKNLMSKYRVVQAARDQALNYGNAGLQLIPHLASSSAHQDTLKNVLQFLIEREK